MTTSGHSSFFHSSRLFSYVELMRPANIITAFADILAGSSAAAAVGFSQVSGLPVPDGLGWLLISTLGLYGGGVVFNDVFDAELDAKERPERAIPSGRISITEAAWLGSALLALAVITAFVVSVVSGIVAAVVAACALFYNAKAKHSAVAGPFFMGLCRGGNLLLGCSIIPAVLSQLWFLALIPIVYIGSITLVSRGEVHGGKKASGLLAAGLIILIMVSLFLLALLPSYRVLTAILFIAIFSFSVLPPFVRAAFSPSPENIKKAVKRGVLSQILLDGAIAAGFAGFMMGGITIALLPVSVLVAKFFSVT